jgi:hypothetical protein
MLSLWVLADAAAELQGYQQNEYACMQEQGVVR